MTMVKRSFYFLLSIFFLVVMSFSFTSAYRYGFVGSLDSIVYSAQPVLSLFFGEDSYNTNLLFEKILLFLLILSVVFVSLKSLPLFESTTNRKVAILLSVIVSLLSVRYINFEWLGTVLMTYQVFGIALTSFLPFIIYFFFLLGIAPTQPVVRKIGWILFICVYLVLYTTSTNIFYGQVYLWTGLFALIFLFADGTIQKYLSKQKYLDSANDGLLRQLTRLRTERDQFYTAYGPDESSYSPRQKSFIKRLENSIQKLERRLL